MTLSSLDQVLVSDEFVADPYPVLRELQAEQPVYWSETIGGWLVTRFDDVMVTFRVTTHYSNEGRLGKATAYLPPEVRPKFAAPAWALFGMIRPPTLATFEVLSVVNFCP